MTQQRPPALVAMLPGNGAELGTGRIGWVKEVGSLSSLLQCSVENPGFDGGVETGGVDTGDPIHRRRDQDDAAVDGVCSSREPASAPLVTPVYPNYSPV